MVTILQKLLTSATFCNDTELTNKITVMKDKKDQMTRESIMDIDSDMMQRLRADLEAAGGRVLTADERQAVGCHILEQIPEDGDLWIFAYGSLIWNPTLHFSECCKAKLYGWQRAFCFRIAAGRATLEKPGLMLGLVEGGECSGVVYRIAADELESEVRYFCKREIFSDIYIPQFIETETEHGIIQSLALTVDTTNKRYCDISDLDEMAQMIAQAEGQFGTNREYLFQTVEHLQQLGVRDDYLEELSERVKRNSILCRPVRPQVCP